MTELAASGGDQPGLERQRSGIFDPHMREVVRGASVSFLTKIFGAVLAFGLNVWLARTIGPQGMGTFVLATTLATAATVVGRVGLDNVVLRLTATHASEAGWTSVRSLHRSSMTLALAASAAAGLALYLLTPWLSERVFSTPGLLEPLRLMTLAIPFLTWGTIQAEFFKGIKRMFASQAVNGVLVPGLSLLGLLLLGRGWGVSEAVGVTVAAAATSAALGLELWRRVLPAMGQVTGAYPIRPLLEASLPLLGVASLNYAMSWASLLMLGAWRTPADVGIFGVASRIATSTSFVLLAVNSIAAPKFAALYRQGDMRALESTARRSASLMTLLAGPVLVVFLTVPAGVLRLFGPEFAAGAPALRILAAGQFVNVATGSLAYLLMMTARERALRNNVFAAAAVNLTANVALIPRWGIVGAALAATAGLLTLNVLSSVTVLRLLGIRIVGPFTRRRP